MSWNSNKLLYAKIQQGLKKANQRIATLIKNYGADSDVVKNELAFLETSPNNRFRSKTGAGPGGGNVKGRKKTKSAAKGNIKIDVRAVNQAIRSGQLSRSEANNLLLKAAGMKIEPSGEVREVGVGITTVAALKQQARARLESRGMEPDEITDQDIDNEIRRQAELVNAFDTEYDEYIAERGIEKAHKRITKLDKKLFAKRDKEGKIIEPRANLTTADIQEITKQMKKINDEKRNLSKKFDEEARKKEG